MVYNCLECCSLCRQGVVPPDLGMVYDNPLQSWKAKSGVVPPDLGMVYNMEQPIRNLGWGVVPPDLGMVYNDSMQTQSTQGIFNFSLKKKRLTDMFRPR